MAQRRRQVVDSKLLTRISGLSFRARQAFEGALTGSHKSPHHGSSVEFAQHREYSPGDEIKHIDWRAYAKSDRHYIKQFEDETNLRAYLVVDCSGSMDYGREGLPTKIEHACRLAAALAWLLIRQGDAVGLLTFGQGLGEYIPPRARPDHFWNLARALEHVECVGSTGAVAALEHIAEVAHRRSLVVLISDCFQFDGKLAAVARQLRKRGHRVVVCQVLDADELEFPFRDLTLFECMESDDTALADPRGMRAQYLEEMQAFCDDLRRGLLDGDVVYHRFDNREPIERSVFDLLRGAS